MSKFTPGPWAVNPLKAQVDALPECIPVCQMLWPTTLRDEAETEANAWLVAASPDLYAAAQCAQALDMPTEQGYAVLESYGWDRTNRFDLPATKFVASMLRAALAKADGGQP